MMKKLTRLLLCAVLLAVSAATAQATDIVIAAHTVINWQKPVPQVWIFYSETFTASDGIVVPGGSPQNKGAYLKLTCTLIGTTLTIPSHTIKSTRDGRDSRSSTVSYYLFTAGGSQITPNILAPYTDLTIPSSLTSSSGCSPTGTCGTLSEILNLQSGVPPLPSPQYYDAPTIDRLFASVAVGAPVGAPFVTTTADSTLTNEFALSSLANGLLKHTGGTPGVAVANTDYLTPTGSGAGLTALNATQLTSGTIPDARHSANVTLLGPSIDLSGAEATGILAAARFPALTGDVTTTAGAVATTLANTAVTPGSYTLVSITVDSKGRITAASNGAVGGGTVTSVGMTVPSFLSVAGSPITTSGTLAVSLSGTALPTTSGGTGLTAIGTANQIAGVNSGATGLEYKSLAAGTAGTDFNIAHTANTVTFNIPDASAANRGLVTTGTQTIAGDKTLSGKLSLTATGVAVDAGIASLVDFVSLGTNDPQKFGLVHGTTGTPIALSVSKPTISIQRVDASNNVTGTIQTLFVSLNKTGGTMFRSDAIGGYGYNSHTAGDIVGVAGLTQVTGTAGGAGNAFGLFGEGTLSNASGLGQANGAEIDVVNNTGLTAPVSTNSLPAGATIGVAIGAYKQGAGSENATIGLLFQGSTQFNHGIFFPNTSLDNTGFGIDFRFLNNTHFTTGAPVAFSNDIYLTGEESGGTLRNLIGMDSSNRVAIGTASNVALFGSSIRPGIGTFASNTAQLYTTASQGVVLTGVAGSAYDFVIAESAGNALLRNPAGTNTLEVAMQGNVVIGGNNGALATTAADGFPYFATMPGQPTGAATSFTGYYPFTFDSANNLLMVYDGTWRNAAAVAAAVTAGSGTGITVNNPGIVQRVVYKVTVTFAALAAAQLTADSIIAVLPAKTRLVSIIADTTTPYTGGATTAATLMVGKTTGGAEYIASHDVRTGVVTKGLLDADLGTAMTRAAAIQGGDLPSWTATTNVSVRLTTVTANTNALTAGSTTYYLTTERMP